MANVINFAGFLFNMAILAIVLCIAGYGVNRLINHIQASRTESKLKSQALVAASRARAHARRQGHTLSY